MENVLNLECVTLEVLKVNKTGNVLNDLVAAI